MQTIFTIYIYSQLCANTRILKYKQIYWSKYLQSVEKIQWKL